MIQPSPPLAVALSLLLVHSTAVGGPAAPQDPPRPTAAEFPGVAARVDLFEKRLNAADPVIRARVLLEITYFAYVPSDELVAFLRRMTRDPDPVVRGRAVRKLHDYWVPLDPEDLPRVFCGYSEDRIVDRDDPQLEERLREQLARPGPEAGWAAYEFGLLRLRSAIPALVAMQESPNAFVRHAAARALLDLGEVERARSAFSAQATQLLAAYERARDAGGGRVSRSPSGHEHVARVAAPPSRGRELEPYYAIVACRGLVECGEPSRAEGLAGLLRLYELLEPSDHPDDQAKLPYLRHTLWAVTGRYHATAREAR